MTDLRQAAQQAPKSRPCDTCNASYKNDLLRIIRCGTCVVRPGQMPTKWRSKMTDLRQAAQQALEALEGLFGLPIDWESGGVAVWRLGGSDASRQAITALRTALEQQQAEPVLLECVTCGTVYADGVPPQVPVQERITHITWDERGVRTVNGIPDDSPRRKELSASEILNMMPSGIPAEYDGELMEFARAVEASMVNKAQREWVGLTDEEILRADPRFGKSESDVNPYQILGSARDLEAKLKERNT